MNSRSKWKTGIVMLSLLLLPPIAHAYKYATPSGTSTTNRQLSAHYTNAQEGHTVFRCFGPVTVKYRIYSTPVHDQTAYGWAVWHWNNAFTGIQFTPDSAGAKMHLHSTNDASLGWSGYALAWAPSASPHHTCGDNLWGKTTINDAFTDAYPATKREAVMMHEIGHTMGLHHEAGCVLMVNNDFDRHDVCGVIWPQTDDINGAKSIYQ